jgi:4-amino-4-deoxy-L-arabinose transferase-like glycosyltransferase
VTTQPTIPSSRRPTGNDWPLLAIFLAGLAVRSAFASLPRVARWDEAAYLTIARNLLAGNGYSELMGTLDVHQPPMVSLLAAAGLALRLPLGWAAAAPSQLLLGSLVVLPLYALGSALYGRRAGLLAALLGALYPALAVRPLYWGTMTEPPYVLFILTGVYAAYRCGQTLSSGARPWGWAGLLGLACGLGYLTRPEALLFLAMMLAYLGIIWLLEGPPRLRRLGRLATASAIATGTLALVALPYVLYLHQATGLWMLSGKAGTSMDISWAFVNRSQAMHDQAAASLDSTGQEIMWLSAEAFGVSITDWIAEDPQRFATLVGRNVRDSWDALFGPALFQPWLWGLIALGLFSQPWTRQRLRGELLLLLALAPLTSLWIVFIQSRFLVVYLAIGLLWAGAGLGHLTDWAGGTVQAALAGRLSPLRRGLVGAASALPVALAMIAMLWSGVQIAQHEIPRLPFHRVEAARWLTGQTPPGTPIMTRNAETTLYANRPMVAFPNAPWEQVLSYAEARGAAFLVVDDWEIREVRPHLQRLLEEDDLARPKEGLSRAYRHRQNGQQIMILRFD